MTRLALLTVALAAVVAGSARPAMAQALPQSAPVRQVVMPFDVSGPDARTRWIGEAAALVLSDELAATGASVVTRSDRLDALERLGFQNPSTLSVATVIRVGQVLGADHVVVGRAAVTDTTLTLWSRVMRLDTGQLAPEMVESGGRDAIFEICARLARRLTPDAPAPSTQLPRSRPPLAAFEQYVKGLVADAPSTKTVFLTQALWLSPSLHDARFALWDVYTQLGESQRALDAIRGVPPGDRRSRDGRFRAAVSLLSLSRYDDAYAGFTDLQREEPGPALANNLGVVQLRRPSPGGGLKASWFFGQATSLDPADADVFFNLGYAHWLDGNLLGAVDALREALRRAPADGEAHYVLGMALQVSGSPTEAAREKDLAKQLSSEFLAWEKAPSAAGAVPRGLERVKDDLGRGPRVEDVIVAAEQRDQRALAAFHLEAGRRLFVAELDSEAAGELRRAIYLSPYQGDAHVLLGRIHLRGGRLADAVDALKVAVWCEDTVPARLALAETYLTARDDAAARTELQIVIARDPQNAEAAQLLARLPPP